MPLVAGIDSSTQSTKVILCDADDGHVVAEGKAPHPAGTECDPRAWWRALTQAGDGILERAEAVAVSAQQHGMVAIDGRGEPVRPAPLWNDTRSAPQARDLVAELGAAEWVARTGSVPTAAFTVTKLRRLAETEPGNAARAEAVMLPHDWLTWRLRGGGEPGGPGITEATTDRSDASGTGYWSPNQEDYRTELVTRALGRQVALPAVAAPGAVVGHTGWGAALAVGSGDNAGAALGLGLSDGDVVVSLGTSGTVFARSLIPAADPTGQVAGFADATGAHLPLVCTLNAARVLDSFATLIGASAAQFDALALQAAPGAAGLALLPYLDGERTPDRPRATGVLSGLTSGADRAQLARAVVEGVLCGLADGIDRLLAQQVSMERVLLIGGAAASSAVRQIAPAIFGVPVTVPQEGEYVALGAARQAAWALSGTDAPPRWPAAPNRRYTQPSAPQVRRQYARLRDETAQWKDHQ